jgi:hypothetical protein
MYEEMACSMLDPFLTEALQRLDQWLLCICDAEERRATLLAGDGSSGWEGVRNLVRPAAAQLVFFDESKAFPLLPSGPHALHRIGKALGLETCELEALLVVLAPYIEPRYQSLYAVLQDNLQQTRPTERLLLAVLGREPERRRVLGESLGPAGRLSRSGFIACESGSFPPLGRPLCLPEDVLAVLLGSEAPAVPGAVSQCWWMGSGLGEVSASWQVIHGTGDRVALARELDNDTTTKFSVRVPATLPEAQTVCHAAWRLGLATGTLPLLDLADLEERDVVAVGRFVETLVRGLGGRAWILSKEPLPLPVPHVESHAPSWAERRQAWLQESGQRGIELHPDEASRLATRHRLQRTEIREVFDATQAYDEPSLDDLAQRMGRATVAHSLRMAPQRDFDDLVLRSTTRAALERLVFYVLNRDRVAAARGLQRRYQLERGPIALFSGRSGTGKTLAAEVVAGALGRPLHTVDLSRLVSKYIGETEKHIDDVLTQGERASAVIFFDEADVLFANRTEKSSNASEHFANMMVGYLLQRIERHDGLVILATNLRHAIDEAFLRRFQFRIEFPLPEPDERLRIWELMLPEGVPRTADVDLESLARSYRLAGGEIRNAALKAIFLAESEGQAVRQAHLEHAVALELLELGRISRRPAAAGDGGTTPLADRGQLLRGCGEALQDAVEAYLRPRILKEIHVIHGSPTKDTLGGRRPAVSITLFRLAARRSASGVRLGFIVSTWSHRAEEEYELLGVVHEALCRMSLTQIEGTPVTMRVQESHDFDLLHRFWSSHEQPVRASVIVDIEID